MCVCVCVCVLCVMFYVSVMCERIYMMYLYVGGIWVFHIMLLLVGSA